MAGWVELLIEVVELLSRRAPCPALVESLAGHDFAWHSHPVTHGREHGGRPSAGRRRKVKQRRIVVVEELL